MARIHEVTIQSTPSAAIVIIPPWCTVWHDVSVVVFSTGARRMNLFHGVGDVIIPLRACDVSPLSKNDQS
jgi:hypothetical protein